MPTAPTQMRLSSDTLADLDAVAQARADETGRPATRTDAVRWLAREAAKKFRKKSRSGVDSVATSE